MAKKKRRIGTKVTMLFLSMVLLAVMITGTVSIWSLYSMKDISVENSVELGETAAKNAEQALEDMAGEQLLNTAVERAAYIEEKFAEVNAYVDGIVLLAEDIYENPGNYPDRKVPLPVPGSRELAAQLLYSKRLESPAGEEIEELLKLGNVQDLLVQYNAGNDMVSSIYLATRSGWMIQADYIAFSKYQDKYVQESKEWDGKGENPFKPLYYEADQRQWFQRAMEAEPGEVVYTDVIWDIHEGGQGIVCASPVYYQGQIVAVAGAGSYMRTVNDAVLNTVIGESGYAFLVNERGQVIFSPREEGETAAYAEEDEDLRKSCNGKLAALAEKMTAGESGMEKIILDGKEVYLAYAPLKSLGWSFVTVMDVEEVVAPAKESQNAILQLTREVSEKQDGEIRKMLFTFILIAAVTTLFISFFSAAYTRKITNPIRKLTEDVAKIDGGSLDCRIELSTGDEVEDLGNAFNHMTAQIQQYIQNLSSVMADKERIRTEIEVASRLQADMLPDAADAFRDRKEFSLYAVMTPAKGVGGDFYDFFLLDDDHLALVMADVSGKGVPAALFMVVSRTLLRSCMKKDVPLSRALWEVNNGLCKNNKNSMFVTVWAGVLTISTGLLTFVNAGHCRPLIKSKDGSCDYETEGKGFVLAGMEDTEYVENRIRLRKGDMMLLYTDGVTEATDPDDSLYGEERLKTFVGALPDLGGKEFLFQVWTDINRFQKDREQFDDITMLSLRYNGPEYEEITDTPILERMEVFTEFVENILNRETVFRESIIKAQLAMDEIISNICYYSGAKELTVGCAVEKGRIRIFFEDDGIFFNPLERPDPDVTLPIKDRTQGGLGIYLVKQQMKQVVYEYTDGKNRLTIMEETE